MVNLQREFEMCEVRECDCNSLMGYYAKGHVDIDKFFRYAIADYSDYCEEEDEEDNSVPFSPLDIKHVWVRYPTEFELEEGYYEYEEQFIITNERVKGFEAMTYLGFNNEL
jgi:hypothetical protein